MLADCTALRGDIAPLAAVGLCETICFCSYHPLSLCVSCEGAV